MISIRLPLLGWKPPVCWKFRIWHLHHRGKHRIQLVWFIVSPPRHSKWIYDSISHVQLSKLRDCGYECLPKQKVSPVLVLMRSLHSMREGLRTVKCSCFFIFHTKPMLGKISIPLLSYTAKERFESPFVSLYILHTYLHVDIGTLIQLPSYCARLGSNFYRWRKLAQSKQFFMYPMCSIRTGSTTRTWRFPDWFRYVLNSAQKQEPPCASIFLLFSHGMLSLLHYIFCKLLYICVRKSYDIYIMGKKWDHQHPQVLSSSHANETVGCNSYATWEEMDSVLCGDGREMHGQRKQSRRFATLCLRQSKDTQ